MKQFEHKTTWNLHYEYDNNYKQNSNLKFTSKSSLKRSKHEAKTSVFRVTALRSNQLINTHHTINKQNHSFKKQLIVASINKHE